MSNTASSRKKTVVTAKKADFLEALMEERAAMQRYIAYFEEKKCENSKNKVA